MKKFTILFCLLAMTIFFIACDGEQNTEADTAETPMEEPTAGEPEGEASTEPKVMTENDSYKTMILEDGIPSPRKEMTGMIGDATITVNYGSPSLRGRKIGTELAPYGELWRTGANMATTIEVSKEVMIEGEKLPAGKYAIFTIPNEEEWVMAFNKDTDQGGTRSYDESKDVLRIVVEPMTLTNASETMEFVIDGNAVALQWGMVKVPFAVSVPS